MAKRKVFALMGTVTTMGKDVQAFSLPLGINSDVIWPIDRQDKMKFVYDGLRNQCPCFDTPQLQVLSISIWEKEEGAELWLPSTGEM